MDLSAAELDLARQEAAERTADLQRVTAEYANYRKRVDRDRESVVDGGQGRASCSSCSRCWTTWTGPRTHGDLVGSFGAVADKLTATLTKLGLARLGAVGDHFDPAVHEAVQFGTSTEVTEPTVTAVFRSGYSLGEKLVRPAVVVVTGPEHEARPERRADRGRRGIRLGVGRPARSDLRQHGRGRTPACRRMRVTGGAQV